MVICVALAAKDWNLMSSSDEDHSNLIATTPGDQALVVFSSLNSKIRKSFLSSYRDEIPEDVGDGMNFTVDPCINFYEHVCGRWIENAEIPPESGSVSKSWDGAEDRVRSRLKKIFEATYPPDAHPPGYPEHPYTRLHDWYQSCMNYDLVQKLGYTPILPILSKVDNIKTKEDLIEMLAFLMKWNIPSFFSLNVGVGIRDRTRNVLFVDAAGLLLPDYSYYPIEYFNDDVDPSTPDSNTTNNTHMEDAHPEEREAMRQYFIQLGKLTGYSDEEAVKAANATLEMEALLAQWMADEPFNASETQGPAPINLSTFQARYPGIPFTRFFTDQRDFCDEISISCSDALLNGSAVIVDEAPFFFSQLSDTLLGLDGRTPADWAPFLRLHVIYNLSPLLSQPFLDAGLEFDKFTSGVESLPPRWQKCVSAATNGLSGLSDLRFLELYFPEKAQNDGAEMLLRIKYVFIQDLSEQSWMDNVTKKRALKKARRMVLNLGAPSEYHLARYPVSAQSYYNNSGWTYHCKLMHMMASLDKPIDEGKWNMRASTVNAYYDNGINALFVPAGIMQPPFFNDSYNMARNFGGIGAIMGHEMTHGFDNTGSKFNENRQMEDWWDKEVVKKFQAKTQCISNLYDRFRIADTQVEGNSTLGENIADFGGMKMAYRAYVKWYMETNDGRPPPHEDLRLFFIAYGQLWCDKERYKSLKLSIDSDVHSPNPFRTNGVVSQNADFADEFQCPAGSPMNPVHKCVLWKDPVGSESLRSRRYRLARHAQASRRY